MSNMPIRRKLNLLVSTLLFITCIAVISITTLSSREALKEEIVLNSLPAKTAEVVAAVDKLLVFPSTILNTVAKNPFLLEWIENGENPDKTDFIYAIEDDVRTRYTAASAVSIATLNGLNYYEMLADGTKKYKKVQPEIDGWFFAFKDSGSKVYVNIHPPDDPHYPDQGFLNIRIEDGRGKFLGLTSVGMNVSEFSACLGSSHIGEKGVTFLVRQNGEIMFHSEKKLNGTKLSGLSGFKMQADKILSGQSVTFETVDAKGKEILVSTRNIPILNAVVVTIADVEELFAPIDKIRNISILVGGGILLISLLILTLFAATLTRPMEAIIAYADDVAAERETGTPAVCSVIEVEKLRLALNSIVKSMVGRLQQMKEKGKEAEEALELSKTALEKAELSQKQAEAGRSSILRAAGELEGIVSIVSSASEQLSAQITQSSGGAKHQAERISETVTAMEEMNVAVLEVARNSGQASELSEQAKEKAKAGSEVVHEAAEKMIVLQEQSRLLKSDMNELDRYTVAISEIMSVISDIADQTNLLALNAAIEAARAGEYGRGFAVVADEVRKLAEKTMHSTGDVAKAITQIQESAAKNIRQVERTGEIVEEVMEKAREASSALSEIVSLVDENSDQVRAIAAASEEQSATSEEIKHSVTEVNVISSETSQAMEKAAQVVSELSAQIGVLNNLMDGMKKA